MQRIAQEMNIPWVTFQSLPDAEKAKVVHVYTNRAQMRNGLMAGGAGAGMRAGLPGGAMQMQQLQQQQQQQQRQAQAQAQMQAALLNRGGVPPGAPANAFAGLTPSTSGAGFAGMGGGGGGGNNINPGISLGALGGMQPQGSGNMGGGFMSQDQINSWMQRSAPGR